MIPKNLGLSMKRKMVWLGVVLGMLYWILDAALDAFFFHEKSFPETLFTPDPMCVWMRSSVLVLFVAFGVYAQSALARREAMGKKLVHANRLYAVLSQINQAIVRIRGRDRLFQEMCRLAVECGGFRMAWIGLVDQDARTVKPVAHSGAENGYLDNIRISAADTPEGCGPTGTAVREGRYSICNDFQNDPRMRPWREEAEKRGYRSSGAFPMTVQGSVIGTFNVYSPESGFFDEEEVKLLEEITTDISYALESMEQESQRKRAEQFNKNILDSMEEGLVVIDPDYRIIAANRYYADLVNMPVEEIIGRRCYEVSHHRDRPCHEAGMECAPTRSLLTGEPHTTEHVHFDKEGNPVHVEIKSYPIRNESGRVTSVIEILNDRTEQQRLEAQLRHAQKMEAVGQFAGGIAHDFNNILTAIVGYGNLLLLKMKEDDPLKTNVEQMLASSERAAALTHSLLAFSRKQIINPRHVNLNEIVRRVEKLLSRLMGEDVELKTRLATEDLTVMADSTQIEQILMNLATNARDAMPEGGVFIIGTERNEIDDQYIKAHGFGKAGTYGVVTVTDAGEGMDEKTREKIFEPFFTTKETGKGTGLGLAIVYGIVKQHSGYINCYSEPGKGTAFRIYFPLISARVEEAPLPEIVLPERGTETILVAEDDADARKTTKSILEEFGYTVIEAADGNEAITQFNEHKDNIRLLLLDVIMPKKNGKEVYDEIKRIVPDVKVLFTSGYTFDIIHKKGIVDQGLHFISKPVSPRELLRKVREVIDRNSS